MSKDVVEKKVDVKEEIKKIIRSEGTKTSKMLKLYELGLDIKVISEIMNVRYNFVYNVVSNEMLKNGKRLSVGGGERDNKKKKIIELVNEGKSNVEIACELKCSYNYVFNIVKNELSKKDVK